MVYGAPSPRKGPSRTRQRRNRRTRSSSSGSSSSGSSNSRIRRLHNDCRRRRHHPHPPRPPSFLLPGRPQLQLLRKQQPSRRRGQGWGYLARGEHLSLPFSHRNGRQRSCALPAAMPGAGTSSSSREPSWMPVLL